GRVLVFLGPFTTSRSVTDADARLVGAQVDDIEGFGGSGDADGDGTPDLLVHVENVAVQSGVRLFSGARALTSPALDDADLVVADATDPWDYATAFAGDLDED